MSRALPRERLLLRKQGGRTIPEEDSCGGTQVKRRGIPDACCFWQCRAHWQCRAVAGSAHPEALVARRARQDPEELADLPVTVEAPRGQRAAGMAALPTWEGRPAQPVLAFRERPLLARSRTRAGRNWSTVAAWAVRTQPADVCERWADLAARTVTALRTRSARGRHRTLVGHAATTPLVLADAAELHSDSLDPRAPVSTRDPAFQRGPGPVSRRCWCGRCRRRCRPGLALSPGPDGDELELTVAPAANGGIVERMRRMGA